jgi:HAD superfamily hydrolase (TIGR01509 family)
MDGVLVDGEPLHFQAVNELMGEEGLGITLEQYKPYMGTKAGWSEMIRDFGLSKPREYYSPIYREMMVRKYREHSIALPGATEAVRGLRRAGVPIAVASSSVLPWVEACLDRIGLAGAFDTIVTGSDVTEGKPHPEIYLLAASRLGLHWRDCLAIEDAPAGVQSAKAAGMTCWAVRTEYTRGIDLPGADRVFESLREFDVDEIVKVAA